MHRQGNLFFGSTFILSLANHNYLASLQYSYVRKVFNEKDAHDAYVNRQRSSSSCNSDGSSSGTPDEQDPIIQARRADVSFRTLAEFQTYQHSPSVVQYLHQPIAMMCVQPDGTPRPTFLYPLTCYGSSAQSWTTTVTQRPGDFEHPVGLDIDDLHQQKQKQPGVASMHGYTHYEVHSVSTDSTYSSTSSVASSSTDCFLATTHERYVQVGGPCRTPEVSPNLVSTVQLDFVSNEKATVLSLQHPSTPARGRCPSEEAEEWHEVLSYFTSSQRHKAHGGASGQRAGQGKEHHVCTPGDEGAKMVPPSKHDLPLPRDGDSFMLGHNGSFSSLFL